MGGSTMAETDKEKNLASFIHCSSLLEERVAKVYGNLANSVDDGLIKCLFKYIALDSNKHSEFFKLLSEWLNPGAGSSFEECREVWGKKWSDVMSDAERLLSKSKISSEEISLLIDGLERLEGAFAEEYLTILHVRLIEIVAEERKIDLKYCKDILEWIIEDENKHEQILKTLKNLLQK
jgi:rubrerythrin